MWDFFSLCVRVEGILNSRPISAMSAEPGDLHALTPGHFLIGRPLLATPEPQADLSDGSIRHHRLLAAMTQSFWRRWRVEYLANLRAQTK